MAAFMKLLDFAKRLLLLSIVFAVLVPSAAWARNIYLNGTDVSSARNQLLENVTLRIDGAGNIFIEAPHYQINEENTYIPLSSVRQTAPAHQAAGAVPDAVKTVGQTAMVPLAAESQASKVLPGTEQSPVTESALPQMLEKEGDKASPDEVQNVP